MSKFVGQRLIILLWVCISSITLSYSQERNPKYYPYGGEKESERYREWRDIRIALKFDNPADFTSTSFDVLANFRASHFNSTANFMLTNFNKYADFWGSRFAGTIDFTNSHFIELANFRHANFQNLARFENVNFLDQSDFSYAIFNKEAAFNNAKFHEYVSFKNALFNKNTTFQNAFIGKKIDFSSASFHDKLDFRGAWFDSLASVDFSSSVITNYIFLGINGSNNYQTYDFQRAKLYPAFVAAKSATNSTDSSLFHRSYPGAKIILFGPVHMNIQFEKLKFVELCDTLSYFDKKDIISFLKTNSFASNKSALFELDYMFEESTKYQKTSVIFSEYSFLHPVRWWKDIYNFSMGLGYRPFRIVFLMAVIIIAYSIFYLVMIPGRINAYISQNFGRDNGSKSESVQEIKLGLKETFINCLYFSAVTFFTFRLNGQYLVFFNRAEKNSVISNWLFGFLVYAAFLTLSKSGSILENLKDLFIG